MFTEMNLASMPWETHQENWHSPLSGPGIHTNGVPTSLVTQIAREKTVESNQGVADPAHVMLTESMLRLPVAHNSPNDFFRTEAESV
jgi:hypothetical protein